MTFLWIILYCLKSESMKLRTQFNPLAGKYVSNCIIQHITAENGERLKPTKGFREFSQSLSRSVPAEPRWANGLLLLALFDTLMFSDAISAAQFRSVELLVNN